MGMIQKCGCIPERSFQNPHGHGWRWQWLNLHFSWTSFLPQRCQSQKYFPIHTLHSKLPCTVCSRKFHLQQDAPGFFWAEKWHDLTHINGLWLKEARGGAEAWLGGSPVGSFSESEMLCFNGWREGHSWGPGRGRRSWMGECRRLWWGRCSCGGQLSLLCPMPGMPSAWRAGPVFLQHSANSHPTVYILGALNPGVPSIQGMHVSFVWRGSCKSYII